MISYAPLWETLNRKEMTTYTLRVIHGFNANTVQRMKKNEYVTLRTVEDLCKLLDCRIEDIVEYLPDKPEENAEETP